MEEIHSVIVDGMELFIQSDKNGIYYASIGNEKSGEMMSIALNFQHIVELRLSLNKVVSL